MKGVEIEIRVKNADEIKSIENMGIKCSTKEELERSLKTLSTLVIPQMLEHHKEKIIGYLYGRQ